MATLYLIDGYAQFFRAFHAIRTPMSSPVTKEPTNMTFGFLGMLLKLLRGEGPHMQSDGDRMLVVALDVSGDRETFRSEIYPEYKAHRDAMPEAMGPQIERCLSMLSKIGVPTVGVSGFEADDAIATIVRRVRAERSDVVVRIVSKDKDLKQLLCDDAGDGGRVEMFDVQTDTLITAESLRAELGFGPERVVDMLALMGDSSDNVPGVDGVGEKTAAGLVKDFGSVEEIMAAAAAGKISGKRGEKVLAATEILKLSKTLVTLRDDVPVEVDWDAARIDRLELVKLVPICRELGFNRFREEIESLVKGQGIEAPRDQGTKVPEGIETRRHESPKKKAAESGGLFGGLFDAAEEPAGGVSAPADGQYHVVRTVPELEAVVKETRRAGFVSVDTETTGLGARTAKLCGVSLAVREGEAWYVPVRSPESGTHLDEAAVVRVLKPVLQDASIAKIGHNLKFDLNVLRGAGVRLAGLSPSNAGWLGIDTMVASYLIDASRSSHSKDALCAALLNRQNIPITSLIGSGKDQLSFERVPLEKAVPYAAEDADVTLRLAGAMRPQVVAMGLEKLLGDVELPLVEVLAEMEWNGIRVDPTELDRQRARLERRIVELRAAIDDEAMTLIGRTFNPDSPKQLSVALFDPPTAAEPGMGLKSVKKTKTGHSTDIEVLEKLAGDPVLATPTGALAKHGPTKIPGFIVEYRQLTKLVGTYLVALREAIEPSTGRVHASFNQTVAATGRLSSSDPNLQNIPIRTDVGREIRKAFVAEPGWRLVSADYSQIELRVLAHLSRDPGLIQAFHEGQDIHTAVAAQIHGVKPEEVTKEQRGGAKMVNFGIVYGITSFGLARRLAIGEREAAEIIAGYKKRFAGITTFLEECVEQARRLGYVETILKRRRPISGIESRNPNERALAERMAINSVVQGSAADLIKVAMVDLYRLLKGRDDARLLLQIHDELVVEAKAEAAEDVRALMVARMEGAMAMCVPIKVDSGVAECWFEG
jgi:DNA polymerase I